MAASITAAATTSSTPAMDKALAVTKVLHTMLHQVADNEDARALFAIQRVSKSFKTTIDTTQDLQIRMGLAHPDAEKPRDSLMSSMSGSLPDPKSPGTTKFAELGSLVQLGPFRFLKVDKYRLELSYHVPDAEKASVEKLTFGFNGKTRLHTSGESSWRAIKLLSSSIDVTVAVHITLTPAAHRFVLAGGQSKGVEGGYEDSSITLSFKNATFGTLMTTLQPVLRRERGEHEAKAEKSWRLWCGSQKMVELKNVWAERRAIAEALLKETKEREAVEKAKAEKAAGKRRK